MSSSPSPSPTTTASSSTHSGIQHVESGVTIPTTTVVGIGAGFVLFALSLLGCLLLVRFLKLALRARRENIPVRQAWNDQGGFFGWLHGFGAQDRETDRIRRIEEIERSGYWAGGGGWYSSEILRMRLWNEIRREGMKVKDDLGERPGMWEVGLGQGSGDEGGDEKVLNVYQPLSVGPTRIPYKDTQVPPPPTIRLSLLIALPTSAVSANPADEELPELVIGSTILSPTIPKSTSANLASPMGLGKEKDEMDLEVAHLEYGINDSAGWVKKGDRWIIEGLKDCMGGGNDV